jgi:hypothetical protein
MASEPLVNTPPTEDWAGRTYMTAWEMAKALGLTHQQFYGLLHAAVLRNDDEVGAWDELGRPVGPPDTERRKRYCCPTRMGEPHAATCPRYDEPITGTSQSSAS